MQYPEITRKSWTPYCPCAKCFDIHSGGNSSPDAVPSPVIENGKCESITMRTAIPRSMSMAVERRGDGSEVEVTTAEEVGT
jgi:hypothetical protein